MKKINDEEEYTFACQKANKLEGAEPGSQAYYELIELDCAIERYEKEETARKDKRRKLFLQNTKN